MKINCKYTNYTLVLLFLIFAISSCSNSTESINNSAISDTLTKQTLKENVRYSLFFDNSLSMMGYYKSKNQFLATINKLTTILSNFSDDNGKGCPVYFINDTTQFIDSINNNNLSKTLEHINNFSFNETDKKRGYTDLLSILSNTIDSLKENEATILVTDGIISPNDNKLFKGDYYSIIENTLYKKSYTILGKLKFQTTIIQCLSDFNGLYIDMNNKGTMISNATRPYYIFIFGKAEQVDDLTEKIVSSIPSANISNIIDFCDYNSLPFKQKILLGENYEISGSAFSNSIKLSKNASNIKLNFLVNLKSYDLSNDYITNPSNYHFNFPVTNLSITPIQNTQDPAYEGYTHKISFSVDNIYNYDTLSITLSYSLSQWVQNASLDNDATISPEALNNRTLGFSYIVNGFYEGYKERKMLDNYFTTKIKINK